MTKPRRQLTPDDFIGKRITGVDSSAVNYWIFQFDDGSRIGIETDSFGYGLSGLVLVDPVVEATACAAHQALSDRETT